MITLREIPNFPVIEKESNIGEVIVENLIKNKIFLSDGDVLCVASKIISIAENRIESLEGVSPTPLAYDIHKKIPRKDPRIIQRIIDQTEKKDNTRLDISDNYIGAWLPNGLKLTSAGIDKLDSEHIILLPKNSDKSAQIIGETIYKHFKVRVAVVITDSDGRIEKKGATQVAIGVYGFKPLRVNSLENEKRTEETLCDMIAAAAGLIMGQRGTGKPVVIASGVPFEFNTKANINDALTFGKKDI